MKVIFHDKALKGLSYWKKTNNVVIINKIKQLVENIQASPFTGLGKPEPLKNELSGYWSRRITQEHRLIYRVEEDCIIIVQCRFHY